LCLRQALGSAGRVRDDAAGAPCPDEPLGLQLAVGARHRAGTIATGHAFVQNLRRGHYELTTELPTHDRLRAAFAEIVLRL
jgi:hypothetical protein